ncbi:hypothetical protein GCM10023091_03450 [Ravibacter arvi]|uniref:Uncharacterized protein n=1 Tax=Ravibacter arvi TaxID=2051041 RepID=A0ABP8LN17_9BACT
MERMASIEWVSKDKPSTGSGAGLRQAQAPSGWCLPDGAVRMAPELVEGCLPEAAIRMAPEPVEGCLPEAAIRMAGEPVEPL